MKICLVDVCFDESIPESITFSNEPLNLSSCSSVPPPTRLKQAL